jgi:hypothetical protein
MKSIIKSLYHSSKLGKLLFSPLIWAHDSYHFNTKKDREFSILRFRAQAGYQPNIDKPTTFNEKMQWLKLNDRQEIHTLCADKYKVRALVEKEIGAEYLIPLLFKTDDIKQLTLENIPDEPCIIKPNHDSGSIFIVKDKITLDLKKAQQELGRSLHRNYYHINREWQYKNIPPLVLIEKLLTNDQGDIPNDYKVFCFAGKAKCIQVDSDRFTQHARAFYDTKWQPLPFDLKYSKVEEIPPPKNLKLIIELAEKLSKPFPFARIDFYEIDNQVYFGEITFHPESGFGAFSPQEWDEKLGNMVPLERSGKY